MWTEKGESLQIRLRARVHMHMHMHIAAWARAWAWAWATIGRETHLSGDFSNPSRFCPLPL